MLGLVLFLNRVKISRRLDVQTKARQRYGSRRLRMTRLTAAVHWIRIAWVQLHRLTDPGALVPPFFLFFLFHLFLYSFACNIFFSKVFFVTKTKTKYQAEASVLFIQTSEEKEEINKKDRNNTKL